MYDKLLLLFLNKIYMECMLLNWVKDNLKYCYIIKNISFFINN